MTNLAIKSLQGCARPPFCAWPRHDGLQSPSVTRPKYPAAAPDKIRQPIPGPPWPDNDQGGGGGHGQGGNTEPAAEGRPALTPPQSQAGAEAIPALEPDPGVRRRESGSVPLSAGRAAPCREGPPTSSRTRQIRLRAESAGPWGACAARPAGGRRRRPTVHTVHT